MRSEDTVKMSRLYDEMLDMIAWDEDLITTDELYRRLGKIAIKYSWCSWYMEKVEKKERELADR